MRQSTSPNLARFLDRLLSRSVLSGTEQQAILSLPTTIFKARANQDIVKLGERVRYSCCVVEGVVARFDQNANGGRQITSLHIPGDMPDLHAAVQPTASSALQALCPATILRVPHEALRQLVETYPAVAMAFWRDSTVDSMIQAQWLVNVGRRHARSRIAHLICEMVCRYKVDRQASAIALNLPMTQTHLADATGLTSVHVNRSLKALVQDGVEWRRGTIYIRDWQRLTEIGDFTSDYLQEELRSEERPLVSLAQ